jgi:hypothetical protein
LGQSLNWANQSRDLARRSESNVVEDSMSTLTASIHRPDPAEYNPYYEQYISLVKSDDLVSALQKQAQETRDLLSKVSAEKAEFRYAPGKWSVKEVVGHINDAERIMSYRVLRIARGDQTPIEASSRTITSPAEISAGAPSTTFFRNS